MESTSSLKKSKKRKHLEQWSNVEDHKELSEHSKNKKVAKREEKKRKNTDSEIKKEVSFLSSDDDEDQNPASQKEDDVKSWNKEDYLKLIRRMELQLPNPDKTSFSSRVEKIDWNQVQFKPYTVEECKEKWKVLRSNVRHFRLLSEILEDAKSWVENPWKPTSKKKATRHPEQPTRPMSSYMLFYMDKKDKVIKKYPDLKLTEVSKLIGGMYKDLSEEHKAYYIEKAREMKEEYNQNLTKFYEKYPEYMKVSKKDHNKTKKPLTPFKLYLREKILRHQHDENFNQSECEEKYREVWKTLSTRKKAVWIRLARDEQDKYLDQLREDENGDEDKPILPHRSIISKEENAILDRLAGKPEKPPRSAYSLFSTLMLQNKEGYIDCEPKSRMKEVANMWKELSAEKKKVYANQVQHMNEIYKLEFGNYLESLPKEKREEELAKVQPKKRGANVKHKAAKVSTTSGFPKQDLFKNEPEKPPKTAWDLYKNKYLKKNSHLPCEIASKKAASMWKSLSPKELEIQKKIYERLKEKYMADFEAFIKSLSPAELKEYYDRSQKSIETEQNKSSEDEDSSSSSGNEEEDESDESKSSFEESDSGVSDEG